MATSSPGQEEESSLNLDPKLAGALCYLFGCVSGILLFLLETKNKEIRFHALQSVLLFTLLSLVSVASAVLSLLTSFLPFQLASSFVWLVQFVSWLVLIIRTYQGATIKIPGIGDFVRQQVGWP